MDEFDEFDEFDEELLLAAVEQVEVKNLIPRQSAPTVPAVVKQAVVKQKTMADFGFVKRAEPSLGIEVEGRATNPVRQSAIESHHKVDQNALKSWIYPINYPLREYQFNIAQFSLFSNTLVCLPTGLGKTFIAAVVMYNFFKWFPEGKIVFMAPTKPLVNQQIDACYKVTGIDSSFCCEMTGNVKSEIRAKHWTSKRMFFMTPETFRNDLQSGTCDAQKVVLVVFDEAHRASGKYAYCDIINELQRDRSVFRVMALSATPGSDAKKVQAVIQNLLIEKLQMRTEESMDVQKNIFKRTVEEVVIKPTPFLQEIIDTFIKFPEKVLHRLVQNKAYREANPMRATVYGLFMASNNFRQNKNSFAKSKHGMIGGDLYTAQQLLRSLETLTGCGLKAFYQEMFSLSQEVKQASTPSITKKEMVNSLEFKKMMEKLEMEMKKSDFSSHPKMSKLSQLVIDHFNNHTGDGETRVMIFSTLRSTVEEIVALLSAHSPLVRPALFVGQAKGTKNSAGMKQKDQLRVISEFHAGVHNVIVATCIGEEGLDIGDLDLIICFDNQKSPIRMLQRCGRTGRKRQGKICLLINEGKEEEAVKAARRSYKNVQNSIIDGTKLDMYNGELAGVIPADCKPTCSKMELVIADIEEKVVKMKKSVTAGKAYLDDEQEKDYIRRFMSDDVVLKKFQLNNHLIWQTSELPVIEMPRSEKSSTFVSLMEYFEDIKGTEAPPQISEKFMKSSQSQRVSNGMPGIKRRVIATLGPSSSFSSDIDVPEHVVKDRKEEDRLHDMLVLHSDDDLLPEFLKTETSKNKPEISVLTGDKCAKYPSYEMLSQDISAIDVEEPEILPNLNCRKECPEVQAIEESMYLSDFSGFESVDISHRRTSVDIAQIEVENNELQGGEMNADPNETVVYSDFEFDDIDLEQIENQYLGPKTVEQAPNSNLIKLPASIPKTPNFSAIKPFTILSTPNVGNKIDMAKRKAAPPLPILMTPVVGSSFKRFKPDKAQPLAMLSTPEVQSSLDNSVFVQQRRSRNNIVLSSNSHASPAVYKNDDPISSSEDEEKITGLRKLLLEKRRKAPRAAPKEREFKIPFKTTHSESVGPPKPRKKRRKNIKAFEMGLIDVEVSVTSDTGTSEEFTGSEYDSDLSGFIAHSQVHDTPGFYRKDLALNGRSDAAKFVPKPAQPLPFSARANPATEDSLGSLADFVNDEIVYSDQSGILPEDQNTQDFEDSLGRSEIGLEISAKPSPCRKAIEDLDVDDMFDF